MKQQAKLSSIPVEIQEDILSRLPVKPILRCKYVCKNWYALVCSPRFVKDHPIPTNKNPRLIIRYSNPCADKDVFYSIANDPLLTSSESGNCDGAVRMDHPVLKENGVELCFIRILGSCNGLLCLGAKKRSRTVILWNPSTNEYKEIILPIDDVSLITCYGFGFDRKIKDYKLVCVTKNEVHVFTLKLNSWRRFNTITPTYVFESAGLLLNGVLHWQSWSTITCFDISSEKFMNWPYPQGLEEIIDIDNKTCRSYDCKLKAWGDSLCVVCGIDNVQVDVWVMQNYGVTESWIKKFTTTQAAITSYPSGLELLWSIENGKVLIHVWNFGLALYDENNDTIKFLNFHSIVKLHYIETKSYVESLVSLNSGSYTTKRYMES